MDTIIRLAAASDLSFLSEHDRHISLTELDSAIRLGRVLLLETADGKPIGWLRWNLFWDNTPFMNLLYLLEEYRLQGYGRALTRHWEQLLREKGYSSAMTSTQANEGSQHFYRHLGYEDVGGFLLPGETYELILHKAL
nr:GNAT family N-acetyltransferase [Clostridia bacterium]